MKLRRPAAWGSPGELGGKEAGVALGPELLVGRGEGVRGGWEPTGGRGVPRAEVQAQGGVNMNNPEPIISPFFPNSSTSASPERVFGPSLGTIAQHVNYLGLCRKGCGET